MQIKRLGKYELLEELGRGGFGTVYRASETMLDVERAVKVLHPALMVDPEYIERFRKEARTAARLDHPNIVPIYEVGEEQGSYFLAMKYLPGGSLKELISRQGILPYELALEVTCQIADALDYANNRPEKLIHRDIKPGNILFEEDGTARLVDFGLAKALAGGGSSSFSASGGLIGTPSYMAPEIWSGNIASPATDVYSLACVFYEMIMGKVLFAGNSPPEIMTRHMMDSPQFPSHWSQVIPAGVDEVLRRALEKDPQKRYPNAGEMKNDILALSHNTYKDLPRRSSEESIRFQKEDSEKKEAFIPEPGKLINPDNLVKINKKKFGSWLIGIGIMLVLGIFFACVVYILPTLTSKTRLLLSSTTTSIKFSLYPTSIVQPTSVILPTSFPVQPTSLLLSPTVPVPPQSNILFSDDFSNSSSGWDRVNEDFKITDYDNGGYRMWLTTTQYDIWANPAQYFSGPVNIEVDVRKIAGPEDNDFGIICNYRDIDNYYVGLFSNDGYAVIMKRQNGTAEYISSEKMMAVDGIKSGSANNHLRLECNNGDLTLYANEIQVAYVYDNSFSGGNVGLQVGTFDTGGVDFLFDNYVVSKP